MLQLRTRRRGLDHFKEVVQPPAPRGMPQLAQGLGLDLADALAGDVEEGTNLFQCPGASVLARSRVGLTPYRS